MNKTLALIASSAIVLGLGTANAAEPMKLTAAQMDDVTAGCLDCTTLTVSTSLSNYLNFQKTVSSYVGAVGNLAEANSTATSVGTFPGATVTQTSALSLPGLSAASSASGTEQPGIGLSTASAGSQAEGAGTFASSLTNTSVSSTPTSVAVSSLSSSVAGTAP